MMRKYARMKGAPSEQMPSKMSVKWLPPAICNRCRRHMSALAVSGMGWMAQHEYHGRKVEGKRGRVGKCKAVRVRERVRCAIRHV